MKIMVNNTTDIAPVIISLVNNECAVGWIYMEPNDIRLSYDDFFKHYILSFNSTGLVLDSFDEFSINVYRDCYRSVTKEEFIQYIQDIIDDKNPQLEYDPEIDN